MSSLSVFNGITNFATIRRTIMRYGQVGRLRRSRSDTRRTGHHPFDHMATSRASPLNVQQFLFRGSPVRRRHVVVLPFFIVNSRRSGATGSHASDHATRNVYTRHVRVPFYLYMRVHHGGGHASARSLLHCLQGDYQLRTMVTLRVPPRYYRCQRPRGRPKCQLRGQLRLQVSRR